MEPRLSQFGPSLAWLLSKDVSSARLATLLHTTAENIRVIAFRGRHETNPADSQESPLDQETDSRWVEAIGVRPPPDEVVRTPIRTRKLDQLRNEIEQTVEEHTSRYDFLSGIRSLRGLMPQVGFAGDVRRIALLARLHQHIAWFLVHSGRCESATRAAQNARSLWKIAFHESNDREYAEGFIQSALIGSQALLLTRRPSQAWQLLEVVRDAARAIGARPGSDHFRQRGVALFQLREDERSVAEFHNAAEAMERLNEARVPAQLLMTGARHTSLLGGLNWDKAQEILVIAKQSFGDTSLEASMALHWGAACGLSTDSLSAIYKALELLHTATEPASHFGHQATIRKLLVLTPDLGLDPRLRRDWVRRTLYENAFRAR